MKLLIDIQGNKPLSAYGDNHVIAYDSNKKSYYVTTAESFFAGQNEKLKAMETKLKAMDGLLTSMNEELTKFEGAVSMRVNNFKSETDRKFDNFLRTYQDTNARLIAMVREVIEAKNEEE